MRTYHEGVSKTENKTPPSLECRLTSRGSIEDSGSPSRSGGARTVGGRLLPSLLVPGAVGTDADVCPLTGDRGPLVSPLAVRTLIRRGLWPRDDVEGFRFCPSGPCPIVYYRNRTSTYVGVEEVTVPVWGKAVGPDVPVCYCLKVTEAQIFEEVVVKGCCRTVEEVRQATRACTGKACFILNPEGRCCGDHLRASVLRALSLAGFGEGTPKYAQAAKENPSSKCCGSECSC